ncbi:EAL domain-containing protein [Marinobacter halodurans]|uniref:EAL domain-containing protein n=2 Tax=Marinobacter halodurans TaxID=2528979 RepID=A0ABY1ZGD1_9GAMM|nr:EAL domain-containing protein [Marinobacter halodurans]
MAHSLHMKVVAEGIEADAQEAFLQFRGCDFAQGFYYGRSMSGEKFLDVCRSNQVPGSIGSIS